MGQKLAVLFVGFCAGPLLVLALISYVNSNRAVRQMLFDETARDMHLVREGLCQAARTMARETANMGVAGFASGSDTQYRLVLESGPGSLSPHLQQMLLARVAPVQVKTPVSQIILVDARRRPLCRLHDAAYRPDQPFLSMSRMETEGFVATDTVGVGDAMRLRPGETALVRLGQAAGVARLRAATPAYLAGGAAPAGVLLVDVELARLLDRVVAEVLPAPRGVSGRELSTFVIDLETSVFLFHHDPARLNQAVSLAAPALSKDLREKGAGVDSLRERAKAGAGAGERRPVDLAALSRPDRSPTVRGMYRGTTEHGMIAYSAVPLPQLGLLVGVAAPRDPFVQPFWRAAAFTSGATVVVLAVSAVLLALFSRNFRHSVRALTRGSESIARGDFSHRVTVSSSDELGELAGAFNRMASDLERMTREREEAARFESTSRVVSVILHDLKGLVFNLSLLSENLARRGADLRFQEEAVATLERLTGRMKRLMTRLPTVVAAGAARGADEAPRVSTDLRGLVAEAVDDMRLGEREGLEVVKELPDDPVRVSLDPEGMRRAIDNLLTNALEAMPRGGRLHICLERRELGDETVTGNEPRAASGHIVLRIGDTGEGIPASVLAGGIFRPFQTTKEKGLGLGLYSAREVVRAHGGEIEVESEVGQGTTFTIRLPGGREAGVAA